jgi:hypothetical protein
MIELNKGHKMANEPDGRVDSRFIGSMLAALHESSVVSQKRSAEEARQRYPPSPAKSVSKRVPEVPYCISDHPGEVWQRIARSTDWI